MINEKIDHHFNEMSPVDFNIFQGDSLYEKLITENVDLEKLSALLDHISIIKEHIESVLNQEDEHLAVVYNFLSEQEQKYYLDFLTSLKEDTETYREKALGLQH